MAKASTFRALAAALSLTLLAGCQGIGDYYGNNPGNQGYGYGSGGTSGTSGIGPKGVVGGLGGAAAGGWAGSQVGKGTGRLAATAFGTLIGALIGGTVGGDLDQADRERARSALAQSLQTNQPVRFDRRDGYGVIYPGRAGRTEYGEYCREFLLNGTVGGRQQRGVGQACQNPDGSWQVLGS